MPHISNIFAFAHIYTRLLERVRALTLKHIRVLNITVIVCGNGLFVFFAPRFPGCFATDAGIKHIRCAAPNGSVLLSFAQCYCCKRFYFAFAVCVCVCVCCCHWKIQSLYHAVTLGRTTIFTIYLYVMCVCLFVDNFRPHYYLFQFECLLLSAFLSAVPQYFHSHTLLCPLHPALGVIFIHFGCVYLYLCAHKHTFAPFSEHIRAV